MAAELVVRQSILFPSPTVQESKHAKSSEAYACAGNNCFGPLMR